jgi:hypothetical protein
MKTGVSVQLRGCDSLLICLAGVALLAGCKSAQVTAQRDLATASPAKPTAVFVTDFELPPQSIQHEEGLLSGRPGPIGRVGDRLAGTPENPAARARQLVDLMSSSLVQSLKKAGLNAIRLSPGELLPRDGWVVRGIYTRVQEGNRIERALIGFGKGQTDVQVIAKVDDLSQGELKPFYEIETDASSGSKPGAAPTLVLSPYGAAARFVMAGADLEKNVKQTASQIAEQVAHRVQSAR